MKTPSNEFKMTEIERKVLAEFSHLLNEDPFFGDFEGGDIYDFLDDIENWENSGKFAFTPPGTDITFLIEN